MKEKPNVEPSIWIKVYTGTFLILSWLLFSEELNAYHSTFYLTWLFITYLIFNGTNILYITKYTKVLSNTIWQIVFILSMINFAFLFIEDLSISKFQEEPLSNILAYIMVILVFFPSLRLAYKLSHGMCQNTQNTNDIIDDSID